MRAPPRIAPKDLGAANDREDDMQDALPLFGLAAMLCGAGFVIHAIGTGGFVIDNWSGVIDHPRSAPFPRSTPGSSGSSKRSNQLPSRSNASAKRNALRLG
jgi:hypothetical protein